jgi:hypothetical protein
MAQLSAEALSPFDHIALDNNAASEAGADDRRHGSGGAFGPEDDEMAPKGSGIPIVEIDDRLPELFLKAFANIESRPIPMHEVGGSARTENSRGAGRSRSVEAHRNNLRGQNAGFFECDLQSIGDLLQANGRALARPRGILAKTLDKKLFLRTQERIIDGGSAKVDSGYSLQG